MSGAPSLAPAARPANVRRHCSRMPWTFSGVTRVIIRSLTSMAGPWSHIPRQLAQQSENLPSGVVWPKRMPRSFSSCRAICDLPAMSQVIVRHRRITNCPCGCSPRKL